MPQSLTHSSRKRYAAYIKPLLKAQLEEDAKSEVKTANEKRSPRPHFTSAIKDQKRRYTPQNQKSEELGMECSVNHRQIDMSSYLNLKKFESTAKLDRPLQNSIKKKLMKRNKETKRTKQRSRCISNSIFKF
ncbi:hypothetical protein KIN20_009776 [Parelaphostrongylus tenuis]|uniref:Uncharacterized protein n=1 Tax=Parelaphostrongylus tenuis TaxID=148309 RepID=A0AAD5MA13_PARTN|nr:hypothetical protein KIN20_009776 [Parelaphostrongylus tenuis]